MKLLLALAAYAALAFLASRTLTEQALRLPVLVILGFFAVRTLMTWLRQRSETREIGSTEGRE